MSGAPWQYTHPPCACSYLQFSKEHLRRMYESRQHWEPGSPSALINCPFSLGNCTRLNYTSIRWYRRSPVHFESAGYCNNYPFSCLSGISRALLLYLLRRLQIKLTHHKSNWNVGFWSEGTTEVPKKKNLAPQKRRGRSRTPYLSNTETEWDSWYFTIDITKCHKVSRSSCIAKLLLFCQGLGLGDTLWCLLQRLMNLIMSEYWTTLSNPGHSVGRRELSQKRQSCSLQTYLSLDDF